MDISRIIRTSLKAYHETHKPTDPNKSKDPRIEQQTPDLSPTSTL